jgi:hypothetical protein
MGYWKKVLMELQNAGFGDKQIHEMSEEKRVKLYESIVLEKYGEETLQYEQGHYKALKSATESSNKKNE